MKTGASKDHHLDSSNLEDTTSTRLKSILDVIPDFAFLTESTVNMG